MPKARDHLAVVAVGGKIHAIGGRFTSSDDRTDLHEIYDPVSDTWTSAPPLPTARSGVAYTAYQGMVLVVGGEARATGTFPQNEAFDPNSGKWITLAPLPEARHGFGAAVLGRSVFFAGGSLKPGADAVTDQLIVFSLP